MNALSKILNPLVKTFNGVVDNMGQRTIDMIRQTYLFIIVALCVIGIIIGFSLGKKSAKKTGMQLVETTNRAFDADIMQSREEGGFGAILEGDLQSEKENPEASAMRLPAREKVEMDNQIRIAEPERDRHIKTDPEAMERQDLPDPSRLDERNPVSDNPIQPVKRTLPAGKAEVIDKSALPPIVADKKKEPVQRTDRPLPSSKDNKKSKLKPLDKNTAITE
ncbi:MAG TPA: hypothetical protein VF857_06725 [Spirochaetota bacterium]